MIDLGHGIDSLTNFKRHTPEFLERLKASGRPMVLTINGRAELVVQDPPGESRLRESGETLRRGNEPSRGMLVGPPRQIQRS